LSLRAARSFYLYLCRRLRLPPPPSPFPYTTLFRSGHHVRAPRLHVDQREAPVVRREAVGVHRAVHVVHTARRGQDGPRRDVLRLPVRQGRRVHVHAVLHLRGVLGRRAEVLPLEQVPRADETCARRPVGPVVGPPQGGLAALGG